MVKGESISCISIQDRKLLPAPTKQRHGINIVGDVEQRKLWKPKKSGEF